MHRDIYADRDKMWSHVDARHQHHLNTSSALCSVAFTGCIDAPEYIPAGACRSFTIPLNSHKTLHLADIVLAVRGIDLEEIARREALTEQLITEILEEERST